MTIAPPLLEQIPDDDPTYLAHVARCEAEGMHPSVAAVQADRDLRYHRRPPVDLAEELRRYHWRTERANNRARRRAQGET